MVRWAPACPHPKQHLDRLSRLSTAAADDRDQQTDRHTDRRNTSNIMSYLVLCIAMRPKKSVSIAALFHE